MDLPAWTSTYVSPPCCCCCCSWWWWWWWWWICQDSMNINWCESTVHLTLRNIIFGRFWSVYQTLIQSRIEAKLIFLEQQRGSWKEIQRNRRFCVWSKLDKFTRNLMGHRKLLISAENAWFESMWFWLSKPPSKYMGPKYSRNQQNNKLKLFNNDTFMCYSCFGSPCNNKKVDKL